MLYLQLVDHDELYRQAKNPPVIVNHFDLTTEQDREKLASLIYTTYNEDSLEVLPSCDCGEVRGRPRVNVKCEVCNTLCLPVTERPLESILYMEAPEGVAGFINPEAWIILENALRISGVSVLEWLTNPRYPTKGDKDPVVIKKLKEHPRIQRGLNYFIENFDEIMDILIYGKLIKRGTVKDREELMIFVRENREALFSKHVPIPSKLMFISENTPVGKFADTNMKNAGEAIHYITNIENSVSPQTTMDRQRATVNAIKKLAEYYYNFFRNNLGPKTGWFRKHIFGSRLHFSFRGVITSLSKPHYRNECHLPWSMAVMFFRIHLVSKLLKRGYTANEAISRVDSHVLQYDELLDEIFQELIVEAPDNGIPIILQRNPSLTRGSAQLLRISKIKTKIEDNTIGISVLILKPYNADFDGDALNGMLIHDLDMLRKVERLSPDLCTMDLNQPRKISKNLEMPAPVAITIANWLREGRES